MDEETRGLVALYLEDNRQAIQLLHEAAVMYDCRYPVDLSTGFDVTLFHIGELGNAERLLMLEALLYAENGKPEQVVDSIKSMVGLARSLSKEPILLSQLVRIAMGNRTLTALENVLNKVEFSDDQLSELSDVLGELEDPLAMSGGFVGERCSVIYFYQNCMHDRALCMALDVSYPKMFIYTLSGCKDSDMIKYLDMMAEYIKICQLPFEQRYKALSLNHKRAVHEHISEAHTILHLFGRIGSRPIIVEAGLIGKLRAPRLGLAIERYRLSKGRLPDALAELIPEFLSAVPLDPFDGNPIRYKKLEKGYVVYSIGEDGRDDNGKEKPKDKTSANKRAYDLTFIVER